jgi:hypothetical protein
MMSVKIGEIPENGLLNAYGLQSGCYTDCFYIDVPGSISFSTYVYAFFNTPVFKLERVLLKLFASSPSSDNDVENLASGASDGLSIWNVEERGDNQMIMSVGDGPIRTWLMCCNSDISSGTTRLYFGSAVLPTQHDAPRDHKMGRTFRILLGFHKQYSRVLLLSAKRKLQKRPLLTLN